MNNALEKRIKEVYPTGLIYEPSDGSYLGDGYNSLVAEMIEKATMITKIRMDGDFSFKADGSYQLAFTEKKTIATPQWLFGYQNPEKLSWIKQNNRWFPILWFKISRVFPAYWHYYNLWKPRENTGYLDTEIVTEPISDEWRDFFNCFLSELKKADFVCVDGAVGDENVDFVKDHEFCDENGNDLDDDAPPRVVSTNVRQCLFRR